MNVLVLGATGLLGQAVIQRLHERGFRALGAARSGTDLTVDVSNQMALYRLLTRVEADAVINCAACVDLAACEADQEMAYRVNGAPAGVLAAWSLQTGHRFIQVSTDNYYDGDLPIKNDESSVISLFNAYAASKFAGETMALEAPNAVVVRTNICGAKKGFGKWVLDSLLEQAPMALFSDYYTSTLHVDDCADCLVSLLRAKRTGLMNIASSDVSSKAEFVLAVAEKLGIDADWITRRSVADLTPRRARSCGLDVSLAEKTLGRKMPTLSETVDRLVAEDARCATLTNSPSVTALSA